MKAITEARRQPGARVTISEIYTEAAELFIRHLRRQQQQPQEA